MRAWAQTGGWPTGSTPRPVGRFPVFIMISGALALDPARGNKPRKFLSKRVWRIRIPLVFWTAVYVVFRRFYLLPTDDGWNPGIAILTGSPFVRLYFLYVLAGLTFADAVLPTAQRSRLQATAMGYGAHLPGHRNARPVGEHRLRRGRGQYRHPVPAHGRVLYPRMGLCGTWCCPLAGSFWPGWPWPERLR